MIEPIDPGEGKPSGWIPDTLEEADYVARQLRHYMAKRAKVDEDYRDAHAKALARVDNEIERARTRLLIFTQRAIESDPDGDPKEPQTYALPSGVELRYRPNKVGDYKLSITSEDALRAWAAEHEALKPTPSTPFDTKKIKDALKNGVDVPGAVLVDPEWEVFSVHASAQLEEDDL